MAYAIMINPYQCTNDSLVITIPVSSYYSRYSDENAPEGLLETKGILEFTGLVNGRDFKVEANTITIAGRANIITTLNMILSRKDLFVFSYSATEKDDFWLKSLVRRAVGTIGDGTLTQGEADKINPILRAYLDKSFENLKALPLYASVSKNVNEAYGDDLRKHPLYQSLGLLMDDYQRLKKEYEDATFFQRRKLTSPDQKGYPQIFEGYLASVPPAYKSKIRIKSDEVTVIDANKIKVARQDIVQGYVKKM